MISFIDEHRAVFGVEPICRTVADGPSAYYENFANRVDVDRLSVLPDDTQSMGQGAP